MKEMGGSVIAHDVPAAVRVDGCSRLVTFPDTSFYNAADVDDQPANWLASIDHANLPSLARDRSSIADLTARLHVEWSLGENDFHRLACFSRLNTLPFGHERHYSRVEREAV